jgi:hypothetical protein
LKLGQKYLKRFEMWCWRRMEKISWNDHVKNELLHRVKKESDFLVQWEERRLTGLITFGVATDVVEGKEG